MNQGTNDRHGPHSLVRKRSSPQRTIGEPPPSVPGARWLPLTRGHWALLDDEDFAVLSMLTWCYCTSTGYAVRKGKDGKKVQMHRVVAGTPPRIDTDHINGNKLDNRRGNLRIASRTQNNGNRTRLPTNKSGYRGVSWCTRDRVWRVCIKHKDKMRWLGTFRDVIVAARAYDEAAREYFGPFARLNFPREGERGVKDIA